MRWIDIIRIAGRMIETSKLRTFLTTLGIGIAVGLIIFLIDLGYGLQDLTVGSIMRSQNLLSLEVTQSVAEATPLTTDQLSDLAATPGLVDSSPVLTTSGELHLGETIGAAAVTATKPSYLAMEGIALEKGRAFEAGREEIVVSPELLDLVALPIDQAVGKRVRLTYVDPRQDGSSQSLEEVEIVGISGAVDVPTIYLPFAQVARVTGDSPLKLTSIKAVAADREGVIQAQTALMERGYQVETLYDTLEQARAVFRWITVGLVIFGLIAMIVASIGMFNTLTIALLERTKEFGIMKAIGVTDSTIKRLFLTEAGLIGMLGGLSGVFIALLLEKIVQVILNQILIRYGGEALDLFSRPPWFLISMVIFPLLLGLITGIYPAMRAAKLNPLKALRYE